MHKILTIINELQKQPKKQDGAVLMVMLMILVVGASALLLNSLNNSSMKALRDQKTAEALAQAKDALISYAINSENSGPALSARPGNFPCPDRDAPGAAGYGDEESSCSSGGLTSIRRLPWKSLSIAEPVDGDGEPLWYVLSDNFRKATSIINSDSVGSLQVYDRDGTTLLTPLGAEAVAIIFAPGVALSGQNRSTNIATCPMTSTSMQENLCASNYLETSNSRNNASSTGPFITANKSNAFNDRMIIIRARDFMPSIEKRIAKQLLKILDNYRIANTFYPYPASLGSCTNNTNCNSLDTNCRGRFPYSSQITIPPVTPNWSGSYALPKTPSSNWFVDNFWYRVIYYSVGTSSLAATPAGCSLTLDVSAASKSTLLIMPGTPQAGITRNYPNSNLNWYFEDTENTNLDDIYVTPSINSNDQLYALP